MLDKLNLINKIFCCKFWASLAIKNTKSVSIWWRCANRFCCFVLCHSVYKQTEKVNWDESLFLSAHLQLDAAGLKTKTPFGKQSLFPWFAMPCFVNLD